MRTYFFLLFFCKKEGSFSRCNRKFSSSLAQRTLHFAGVSQDSLKFVVGLVIKPVLSLVINVRLKFMALILRVRSVTSGRASKYSCIRIEKGEKLSFLLSSMYIRRKYWIRENFRLPVFDGFTCFEMS